MKKFIFFLAGVYLMLGSCTKDKTDYEAAIDTVVPEYLEFKEVVAVRSGKYDIRIEALNGTFYKGYNEIRLKVTDHQTKQRVDASDVTFLPIATKQNGSMTSCPHRYDLASQPNIDYFSGYVVFTSESGIDQQWALYLSIRVGGQLYSANQEIDVQEQTNMNLNMVTFAGKEDRQYVIALVSPQKPKIGENELVAGIYRLNHPEEISSGDPTDILPYTYAGVSDYTLRLDPRMPEPSMGNHSSPNNQDLTQRSDGLYHGVVNYTMTGNWTLNFILVNAQGRIEKGTVVPTDFTPGVEGVKSELHLDILF